MDRKAVGKELARRYGRGLGSYTNDVSSIWQFTNEMRIGDIVVANDGKRRVVGIGRVTSGYLAPRDRRNPVRTNSDQRHVRLVDWIVKDAVDFSHELLAPKTVYPLRPKKCDVIQRAYERQHPRLKNVIQSLFQSQAEDSRLAPAADEADSEPYTKPTRDARDRVTQDIFRRRGQGEFRNKLLARYSERCVVTGCLIVDVLEAAHIDPYRGGGTNHEENGLLFRADIHTLFDLNKIGIDPVTLKIRFHPDVREGYRQFDGKVLKTVQGRRPATAPLRTRFKKFQEEVKAR